MPEWAEGSCMERRTRLWGRILRGRVGIVGRRVLCVVLRGAVAVVVEVGAFVGTVAIIATRIILRRGR